MEQSLNSFAILMLLLRSLMHLSEVITCGSAKSTKIESSIRPIVVLAKR